MNSPTSNRLTAGDRTVPWLNQLKDSWKLRPLKYCCSINQRTLDDSTAPDTPISYIDISSVDSNGTVLETTALSFGDAPSRARRILATGDTFVSTVRTYLTAIGYCTPEIDGFICSTGFAVLSAFECVDTRFLYYWMRSTNVVGEIVARSVGVSYPAINASEVGNLPLPTIPLPEQRAIAAFLDRKTAQIDAVVAKKQQLIELLQEKRQSLISHAVTKGLDPHAPMKDSGIEWLGEIPAHWKVMKLKHWVSFLNNRRVPISSEDRAVLAKEYPYYGASGIIDYVDDYIFDEPLILIGEDGANLLSRSSRLAFIADGKFWVNNHAHILRPKSGCLKFWSERLESISYVPFVTGSAQPKLTIESLANIEFAAPDESEQAKIGQFVDAVNLRIDGPLQKLAQQITKLQEYRQTLISAAVTGKIDVTKEAAS